MGSLPPFALLSLLVQPILNAIICGLDSCPLRKSLTPGIAFTNKELPRRYTMAHSSAPHRTGDRPSVRPVHDNRYKTIHSCDTRTHTPLAVHHSAPRICCVRACVYIQLAGQIKQIPSVPPQSIHNYKQVDQARIAWSSSKRRGPVGVSLGFGKGGDGGGGR